MSTVEPEHNELMEEVRDIIRDAEYKVLSEHNEVSAIPGSGLAILFSNWSQQK